MAQEPDIKSQILAEIYQAMEDLGADEELLAIVGSWRDTLDDAEVWALLKEYKTGRPTLQPLE